MQYRYICRMLVGFLRLGWIDAQVGVGGFYDSCQTTAQCCPLSQPTQTQPLCPKEKMKVIGQLVDRIKKARFVQGYLGYRQQNWHVSKLPVSIQKFGIKVVTLCQGR